MIKPLNESTKSMEISEELLKSSERLKRATFLCDCAATIACLMVACGVFWYFLTMYGV